MTNHGAVVLLILVFGLSPCGVAQLSFSDSSPLKDTAYVRKQIQEISDPGLWSALDLSHGGLEEVRTAVRAGKFNDAATAWMSYWGRKKRPSYITETDHLLFDTDLLTGIDKFQTAMQDSPEERDTIIARAEMILQNTIRTWGDIVVRFGDRVDFNREIGQSGKYGFHYWIWSRPLIMSSVLTGDEKYLAKFDQLFNAWYEQRNSITRSIPKFDVVYYELGLGVRNRMFVEYYLLPYRGRSAQTHARMLKTVLGAGRWLYELERWEGYRPGNWQIHGSYMLVQLALVFPEFRESAEWLRLGLQRMTEHLQQDFFPDGGHSERAPRNYTLATYLTYRNLDYLLTAYGIRNDIGELIHSSIGRTIDWWISMLAPTGEVPAVNDSHRGLFPTRILRDAEERLGNSQASGILDALFGEKKDGSKALPEYTSRHMPASGFSVMRTDWTKDALYLAVNYGAYGGPHTHHDLLDFELYAYGKPLAVDAGIGLTYDDTLYVPWYKSSRAHNMVVVNDSDIQREGIQGENIRWASTRSLDFFAGEHRGYERFGTHHRRQIAFVKPSYWFVLDDLTSSRTGDTLSWYFHSPGELVQSATGFAGISGPGLRILPAGNPGGIRAGKGWAASSTVRVPGKTEEIPWIRFDQTSSKDSVRQFAILLAPFRHQGDACSTEKIADHHYVVNTAGSSDHLYFTNGAFADGTVETDGSFVCIRLRREGPATYAIVNGTYLRYNGRTLWKSSSEGSGEGEI